MVLGPFTLVLQRAGVPRRRDTWVRWGGGWRVCYSIVCPVRFERLLPHVERYRVSTTHKPGARRGEPEARCACSSVESAVFTSGGNLQVLCHLCDKGGRALHLSMKELHLLSLLRKTPTFTPSEVKELDKGHSVGETYLEQMDRVPPPLPSLRFVPV